MTMTLRSLAAAAATLAMAQSLSAPTLQPAAYSSSSAAANPYAGEDIDGSSPGSAPDGKRSIVDPQFGGGGGNGGYHRYNDNGDFSHFTFELGGGFTAPIGNDVNGGFTTIFGDGSRYGTVTYGGNLLVGAGWNFTKKFAVLGELSYNANKIPGHTLSALYAIEDNSSVIENGSGLAANGIPNFGGNVHTFGYTAEPIFYYYNNDKHKYAGYIIGGVGLYHRSVNFTAPTVTQSFYGSFQSNQTFVSSTDNSIGYNLGTGVTFKPLGEYSHLKLFAEARYVFVNSPRETQADLANTNSTVLHTGTEELIPISFGIRF